MWQSWLLFWWFAVELFKQLPPMKHSLCTNTIITVESAMLAAKSDYFSIQVCNDSHKQKKALNITLGY